MAKIHHNTAKRAASLGLDLMVDADGETVVLLANGKVLARGTNPKDILDAFVAKYNKKSHSEDGDGDDEDFEGEGQDDAEGDVDEEAGDEEDLEDEPESRSIVKKKYKVAYRPFRNTCGDEITRLMAPCVKHEVTVVTKSGKKRKVLRTDPAKLKRLAKANGVWRDEYADLNVGQQSMNIANRLRKLVKDGVEIKWI